MAVVDMSKTTVAEYITEFFYDMSVDQLHFIFGKNAVAAINILLEAGFATLEDNKLVLTKKGKKLKELPSPDN